MTVVKRVPPLARNQEKGTAHRSMVTFFTSNHDKHLHPCQLPLFPNIFPPLCQRHSCLDFFLATVTLVLLDQRDFIKTAGMARCCGRRSISSSLLAYCMQSEKLAHRVHHYYTVSRVRSFRDDPLHLIRPFIPLRTCS